MISNKNWFVVLGGLLLLVLSACGPAIFDAVRVGDTGKVESLLTEQPQQINARDDRGLTPLHSASIRGYKEVVELLIANGADVNARDNDGNTPLHRVTMAVGGYYRKDHKEIAELLIVNGANVYAKDQWGKTPLYWARAKGYNDVVELLRKQRRK
jgi:ankyrin repeat protein